MPLAVARAADDPATWSIPEENKNLVPTASRLALTPIGRPAGPAQQTNASEAPGLLSRKEHGPVDRGYLLRPAHPPFPAHHDARLQAVPGRERGGRLRRQTADEVETGVSRRRSGSKAEEELVVVKDGEDGNDGRSRTALPALAAMPLRQALCRPR